MATKTLTFYVVYSTALSIIDALTKDAKTYDALAPEVSDHLRSIAKKVYSALDGARMSADGGVNIVNFQWSIEDFRQAATAFSFQWSPSEYRANMGILLCNVC